MKSKSGAGERSAEGFSLRRWSRRKLEAVRATPSAPNVSTSPLPAAASQVTPQTAAAAAPPLASASPTPPELPPVASLTFDSDFAAFLKPQVDELVKRAALKQLFRDPRFNVMDGLDTYIDDYTQAEPIPPDMLQDLMQRDYIYNPPTAEATTDENAAGQTCMPQQEQLPGTPTAAAVTSAGASASASATPADAPIADNADPQSNAPDGDPSPAKP